MLKNYYSREVITHDNQRMNFPINADITTTISPNEKTHDFQVQLSKQLRELLK